MDPIELSARFLEAAGERVDHAYLFMGQDEPAVALAVGMDDKTLCCCINGPVEPVPDLTAEAELGRVVRICREGVPNGSLDWNKNGFWVRVCDERDNPNIALMVAFIKTKGGTLPEGAK